MKMYSGMVFVAADETDAYTIFYMIESTAIKTAGPGVKSATVYRVETDGKGDIQSWQFRCKDFGIKLLADHAYQHEADNTWTGGDGAAPDSDFLLDQKDLSLGKVAQYACKGPKGIAGVKKFNPAPDDPVSRIQVLILSFEGKK